MNAVKTSDVLAAELLTEFGEHKPETHQFDEFAERLVLRNYVHAMERSIAVPIGRSAALSIATAVVFLHGGSYKALVRERSKNVAVYGGLLHVAPSGMFQPVFRCYEKEYSIRHNFLREYLEELMGRADLDLPKGEYAFDFFYDDPNLRHLRDLEAAGEAALVVTGLAVDLFNLRPEICTLLLIRDSHWFENQSRGAKVGGHQLTAMKANWEFKGHRDEHTIQQEQQLGYIELGLNLEIPEEYQRPYLFAPPGLAALELGLKYLRSGAIPLK